MLCVDARIWGGDRRKSAGGSGRSFVDLANAPLQEGIRDFLKRRTAYDVLPVSFRLIVLDTSLFVRKSLKILVQNSRSITEGSGLI